MSELKTARVFRRVQKIAAALSLLIVGCALSIFLGQTRMLIAALSTACLVAGLCVVVLELFMRWDVKPLAATNAERIHNLVQRDTEELVYKGLNMAAERSLGLVEVHRDSETYDFSLLIAESHQLIIVLNVGRTWVSVHRERLRRRFEDPRKETTVFLLHPNSTSMSVLARKGSTDVQSLQAKLRESVRLLREVRQPWTNLSILGHHLFNSYSVVAGDESAVISPYFLSRGSRAVPALRFKEAGDSSLFREIMEDLERLRIDSEDIRHFGDSAHGDKTDQEERARNFELLRGS